MIDSIMFLCDTAQRAMTSPGRSVVDKTVAVTIRGRWMVRQGGPLGFGMAANSQSEHNFPKKVKTDTKNISMNSHVRKPPK